MTIQTGIAKVWKWLAYSSADPAKFAVTLKAGIPFLLIFFGWAGVDQSVVQPVFNELAAAVTEAVVGVVQVATAVGAAYGLVRKIYYTIRPPTRPGA